VKVKEMFVYLQDHYGACFKLVLLESIEERLLLAYNPIKLSYPQNDMVLLLNFIKD
jgi:hypothetical protein